MGEGERVGGGGEGVMECVMYPPLFSALSHSRYGSAWAGKGLPREDEMIYRGPGFLRVVFFGSSPTPSPPLSHQ
jgi:hypothetical protein